MLKILLKLGITLAFLMAASTSLTTFAVQGTAQDLYYLAADANGVVQVFSIDSNNSINPITQEAGGVVAYDLSPNNRLAYATPTSIVIDGNAITTGGFLDTPNLQPVDLAWSPTEGSLAVVAQNTSGAADPSEGVWLYDIASASWTSLLTSSKSTPTDMSFYQGVQWARSGDRLLLDTVFSDDGTTQVTGATLYALNTGRILPFNQAGTGIIDPNGYSRANFSLDGTSLILSDVPGGRNGDGFDVDINNYSRIIPLGGADLGPRFLSHAVPIRGGTAYFIRDFGNALEFSETWQLSTTGARVALGRVNTAALAYEVDWTPDGEAVAYVLGDPQTTEFGDLEVYQRVEDRMEIIALPEGVGQVKDIQWTHNPNPTLVGIEDFIIADPLFEFQDEAGTAYYSVRAQWNAVPDAGAYTVALTPGFDGAENFTQDVATNAVRFNRLVCDTTYNLTVTASGAESRPVTFSVPTCDSDVYPTTATDLYPRGGNTADAPPPDNEQPAADGDAATPPAEQPEVVPTVEESAPEVLPFDPNIPTAVTTLAGAAPVAEGTLSDGSTAYTVNLTWSVPTQPVRFYLVVVDPPFGDNQRDRIPVASQPTDTEFNAQVSGLACGTSYSFTVQSIGADGSSVEANSNNVTLDTPPC